MSHRQDNNKSLDEESVPLTGSANEESVNSTRPSVPSDQNIWKVTTFILAFLLLLGAIDDFLRSRSHVSRHTTHQHTSQPYSYETGFETDWSLARDIIRTKQVKFSGGIRFHENGSLYMTLNPDDTLYVGPPSQQIDDAWDSLTRNLTIAVSRQEAKAISDQTMYDEFRGHYSIGVSVLHSLHCLNAIRIGLDVDYYRKKGLFEEWWKRIHIDHCINHIRQVLQCHGDLTPIPLYPASRNESKKGWITPNFDQYHTCRDFSAIREWSDQKHYAGMRSSKANAASHNKDLSD